MILVRLKHLISCLGLFFVITIINLATFAQATSDTDANRSSTSFAGNPNRASLPPTITDGIDSVNNRIASESFDRVWQMTGPFGGDVTALAIDPRNADHILLGTNDGQIYYSRDGGVIWRRVRPGIKAYGFMVTVILFDLEKSNTIYVGVKAITITGEETKGGNIFVSEDRGQNWRELEGMHGRPVRGMVQSTKDPNVLVTATIDGIYRSMDRGQSWERITPHGDPELRGFHSVAIDPRDVDVIYAGTNHLPWKTLDGGKTWKRAGAKETGMIDDSDIFAIHIDETNPDTVLMSACSGIYRSLDASAKWTKIQGIPYTSRRTHVIYQHPTKPEVIFAGTTEGLWLSTNHGKPDSWQRVTSLRLVINSIAIHPDRPDRVFLGTEDRGVLISMDSGESYEPSNAGFINRQVRTVLADQKEHGRIYAGVIFDSVNGGLFISEDGGLTWQQSMSGMGVRDVYSLYQSPTQPETIYAGTNHGLFRSDDQGRNWKPVKKEEPKEEVEGENKYPDTELGTPNSSPPGGAQPAPSKSRPRRVKSTGGNKTVEPIVQTRPKSGASRSKPSRRTQAKARTSNQANAKSGKQAKTKTMKQTSVAKKQPPRPSDLIDLQSQIFMLVQFIPRRDTDSEVVDPGVDQSQSRWLIALNWNGLYRTEDEQKGWKEIKLRTSADGDAAPLRQPRINSVATSPHAPGVIFAGTEEGLFVSRDNGQTFKLTVLDEEQRRIRCITFDPRTADTIYVGTSTGFFRSTDRGSTWEQRGGGMPLLSDVTAIAIGSLNPDELYVGDDLRGGFYHSKDRGKNWEKLDISQLPSTKIWSMASDPFVQHKLYIGSFSGGVYVMSRK